MRILQITAGAAGMYCGSCTRDNALARELLARGHEVTLVPVYTPTRPDEPNVSRNRVLFGGISVYLQQHVPLFRRTPRMLDRMWDSPRVIGAFARRAISTDARTLGDLTISMLQGERGVLRKEFEKLIDWIGDEPLPEIINLPNSLLIALAAPLKRAFRRPVCCTLQGEELFLDGLVSPFREEARALIRDQTRAIDRFVAVSDYCAAFMSSYLTIPASQISVVPLGISMEGYEEPEARSRGVFTVGYFARIAPEKGLHLLADAYVRLRQRTGVTPMRLEVAGYLARSNQSYLDAVRRTLDGAGYGKEFSYRGELDRTGKLAFLRQLDVLSVPATYDEPKGMFLLEAMASGVPVVQPRRGAFVEIVERTGGGVLVTPDNPDSLADGLHTVWSSAANRSTLAGRAFHGVRTHYTVSHSAGRLLDVYASVLNRTSSPGLSVA
jgi:glycosyltransferase involved in cell wall biosynthesis